MEIRRGNRLGGAGGIGRGVPKPLPFKLLSKNPSRQSLVREKLHSIRGLDASGCESPQQNDS